MTLRRLVWRTLLFYRGPTIAVAGGLAIASAVIAGSLIIGSSLRGSLLDLSLRRLGTIAWAALLPRPVSAEIVANTAAEGLLQATGTANPAVGEPRPVPVTIWGVDKRFASAQGLPSFPRDGALINAALARELFVQDGDEIALSVHRLRRLHSDSLFARRKLTDVVGLMTLSVAAILPDHSVGDLRLDGQAARPLNVFVDRRLLTETLGLPDAANVLVLTTSSAQPATQAETLTQRLRLSDYGLHLRLKPQTISLTSEAFTLPAAELAAARQTAERLAARAGAASIYLATSIRASHRREIAYAVLAGVEDPEDFGLPPSWRNVRGDESETPIVLNRWAAEDLQARPGERLVLEYLEARPDGTFPTRRLRARLIGIVPLSGRRADPHLMPEYEGLTDAATMHDWDPPFPFAWERLRRRDELYWQRYRAAPKAFLPLVVLRQMWGPSKDYVTSLEITPPPGQTPAGFAPRYAEALAAELLRREQLIVWRDLRAQASVAAQGSTDFGVLFLAMSMFLVAAGLGLAALLLRLLWERRQAQLGLLKALGLRVTQLRQWLWAEALILNGLGGLLGLPLGLLYAKGLLWAMSRFWRAALGDAPALWLHVAPWDLPAAFIGGFGLGILTLWLSGRGLERQSPLTLWRGEEPTSVVRFSSQKRANRLLIALLLLVFSSLSGALVAGSKYQTGVFFGVGSGLLVSGLLGLYLWWRQPFRIVGALSLRTLAWRNAARHPQRSLLSCGLVAAAAFVIIATAASTRDFGRADPFDREGPTGGFNLLVEASAPLPYDPTTPAGRRHLGFTPQEEAWLSRCVILSFLRSPGGDDLSCTNAARPQTPPLLAPLKASSGAADSLLAERFGAVRLALPPLSRPWGTPQPNGAREIATYTDASTLQWRLHRRAGELWETRDLYGRPLQLRLYVGFSRSIFAGYLLTSAEALQAVYPAVTAPSFFLIETPREAEKAVIMAWQRVLGDFGVRVRPTRELLAEYAAGENVYISMFLALGALGLLLGTIGLALITARNIWERRSELALLAALGFSRQRVIGLLLWEHGGLLAIGLGLGAAAALLAMWPALRTPESAVYWPSIGGALSAIMLVGLGANALFIRLQLGYDLISALRRE